MKANKTNRRLKVTIFILLLISSVYYMMISGAEEVPKSSVIRVGILPDESPKALQERYSRLIEYLSKETKIQFELVYPKDYSHLLNLFGNHQVDLAYLGGLTFLKANKLYAASPIVMREVDTRFTSWFIVKSNQTAKSIVDFKGKTFSFGNMLSTSGHLMPRYFLENEYGIVAEDYFSNVGHAKTHDVTVQKISDGEVELAAVNSNVVQNMLQDGRLKSGDVRVLWESAPYYGNVWVVQKDLQADVKINIRNAFLNLDINRATHTKILQDMRTTAFLPAGKSDFSLLETIAIKQGVLE